MSKLFLGGYADGKRCHGKSFARLWFKFYNNDQGKSLYEKAGVF